MGVRDFIEEHYRHFNAGVITSCVQSLEEFIKNGGKLMVTLAGAMSTAEIGRTLAPAIRAGLVHGISCTGANLEEEVFNLVARNHYENVDWRNTTAKDDWNLRKRGMNRVTDTCIPEDKAVRYIEKILLKKWLDAEKKGECKPPHEYLMDVIKSAEIDFQVDPNNCWLIAADEMDVPIFTPGWADSTLGNILSARVMDGTLTSDGIITTDLQRMQELALWYSSQQNPVGLLQVGGGIAGDFPICVVPMLRQDLGEDVALWGWFAQISESRPSYGGYSGAPPNEKISWDKLGVETPRFVIESDATIVLPLIFTYLLEGCL
ncbi:MAG TPA: deoxyhypusine synthase family protein [Candidatus Thalassarchaeaceae archaeon]|nr:deoxyhypusine synthase family protein [Candidatus Thalassarchaeaceae archaeon]